MPTSKCKSCGAAILWVKDQWGKVLPVNKRRVRAYHMHVPDAKVATCLHHGGKDMKPYLVHISHFLTCPDATKHSKSNADQPHTVD